MTNEQATHTYVPTTTSTLGAVLLDGDLDADGYDDLLVADHTLGGGTAFILPGH